MEDCESDQIQTIEAIYFDGSLPKLKGLPPVCSICTDTLGTWGVPTFLCGHNVCLKCLQKVKQHTQSPSCPICSKEFDPKLSMGGVNAESGGAPSILNQTSGGTKLFYCDSPLPEETGSWIPVSVPPVSDASFAEHLGCDDSTWGIFPEDQLSPSEVQLMDTIPELTMWSILFEVVAATCGTRAGGLGGRGLVHFKKQAHYEYLKPNPLTLNEPDFDPYASILTEEIEEQVRAMESVLAAKPPKWLPDSSASICPCCGVRFHPLICPRHHCRFCGGLFCGSCSTGKSLLPLGFREDRPRRVCDCCLVKLAPVQEMLYEQVSQASQSPTHDITNLSSLRAWVNSPFGVSMEYEIYKATNSLRSYLQMGELSPERCIPETVLRGAEGLAIITVLKAGMMVTYKVGTGLVVARKQDGTWSGPSAIASFGVGWGAQAGGEITDFIIVLRTRAAVKAFAGQFSFSLGAGVSAAVGPVGRTLGADLCAGNGGSAACYTYSRSKGAFVGCSLEGSVITTRSATNANFYGDPNMTPIEILLGESRQPKAAIHLHRALSDLFTKFS